MQLLARMVAGIRLITKDQEGAKIGSRRQYRKEWKAGLLSQPKSFIMR